MSNRWRHTSHGAVLQMRILYVTDMWVGLRDILVLGEDQPRGMPAMVKPLRALVEAGHTVDLLVAAARIEPLAVGPAWLERSDVELVRWDVIGQLDRARSAVRLLRASLRWLRRRRYDFVYAQGAVGGVGNLAALLSRVPCGGRLYGSFLGPACVEIEQLARRDRIIAAARLRLAHPLETACLRLRKSFLIATNDGTHVDVAQRVLGRDVYEFHHVFNGRPEPAPAYDGEPRPPALAAADRRYILYPARMVAWKRPHLALELLARLDGLAGEPVELAYAGATIDEPYVASIMAQAGEAGLADRVHVLGSVAPERLAALRTHPRCLCVASFYEFSNLGNVAIEALADAALVVSLANSGLENLVRAGESAVLGRDVADAAEELARLMRDPTAAAAMRAGAARAAAEKVPSWPDRIAWEMGLIERAAARQRR